MTGIFLGSQFTGVRAEKEVEMTNRDGRYGSLLGCKTGEYWYGMNRKFWFNFRELQV